MGLIKINANMLAIGTIAKKGNNEFIVVRKNRLFKKMNRNICDDHWKDVKNNSIYNYYDTYRRNSIIDLELLSEIKNDNGNLKISRFKLKKLAKEIDKFNYEDNNPNNKLTNTDESTKKVHEYIKKLR